MLKTTIENYPYSCPISETVSNRLRLISWSFSRAAAATTPLADNSPEPRFLAQTAQFFRQAANQGAGLEYLPQMGLDKAFSLLDPWFKLGPLANSDLSYAWNGAIVADQEFRWNEPWSNPRFKKTWTAEVFSAPILMQVPIVFARVTSESSFAGRVTNLQWHVLTPYLLAFGSYDIKEVKPGNDWYHHTDSSLSGV